MASGTGFINLNAYQYYVGLHGSGWENRWRSVGYLFAFIGGFQVMQFLQVKYRIHASR